MTIGRLSDTETKARKRSLRIAESILRDIKDGIISTGSLLETEVQLAREYEVGPSTIREALAILEALGVVEVRHGVGRLVRGLNFAVFSDPLLGPGLVDSSTMAMFHQLRVTVETETASLAAENASDLDKTRLQLSAARMLERVLADDGTGIEEDNEFHKLLAQATQNKAFLWMHLSLEPLAVMARRIGLAQPGRALTAAREHVALANAVSQGDAAAAKQLIREHLEHAAKDWQIIADTIDEMNNIGVGHNGQ